MGIASYDLEFDGFPEYFLTSMADNKLQSLATVPKDGQRPRPLQGRGLCQRGHGASALHGR